MDLRNTKGTIKGGKDKTDVFRIPAAGSDH